MQEKKSELNKKNKKKFDIKKIVLKNNNKSSIFKIIKKKFCIKKKFDTKKIEKKSVLKN